MKLLNKIAILILINLLFSCADQVKVVYHEYEPTASDFTIVKWDIPKTNLPEFYVKETSDKEGRVIELQFFEKENITSDHLCYLVPWVKYKYPNDTTIIQFNLDEKGNPEMGLECEVPTKVMYSLSKTNNQIVLSEAKFEIDYSMYLANGWTTESISQALASLEGNKSTYATVDYYSKSKFKLKGRYPVSKDFKLEDYDFNEQEKREIELALEKE